MSQSDHDEQQTIRELAYALWEEEGRPHGRELAHWERAVAMRAAAKQKDPLLDEAEAVIDGDLSADFQALATKDVSGG